MFVKFIDSMVIFFGFILALVCKIAEEVVKDDDREEYVIKDIFKDNLTIFAYKHQQLNNKSQSNWGVIECCKCSDKISEEIRYMIR